MLTLKFPTKLTGLVGCLCLLSFASKAQTVDSDGDNFVKLNVSSLFLKTFSVQYERPVGQKISVAMNMSFRPTSAIPFKGTIKNIGDNNNFSRQIDGLDIGHFVIAPEFRFYTGSQAGRGFYIAPYAQYTHQTAKLPFKYDYDGAEKVLPLSGSINSITGGLMFGAQFKLSKLVYLDWWILGATYGTASGKVDARAQLDENEQQAVRNELDAFNQNDFIKTEYTVDQNGAKMDVDGRWATVRLGLALGIRF
ncbi:DUF3575 domain-containing protein [Mucilaginibacter sp. JRF]|uniref:DUF3575 domain-containing protein n=1 Tax=Mucilaginibacter sp. JRF TaxID=2780088 RepID=UPI00187F9609|nr:DUF3575 domain-containing protein [Mucilaginibacter sp. JRF]MBE9586375.1 DUF3575 domain-containing protein [Mucilaginibacter sp. JRF]